MEGWIEKDPSIVGSDIFIIDRQVQTRSGPLDLLAIDRNGNQVIIELKRDKLPRVISQQIGMKKNDFLRQVIQYEYPNYPWEKDNYKLNNEHAELLRTVLSELNKNEESS